MVYCWLTYLDSGNEKEGNVGTLKNWFLWEDSKVRLEPSSIYHAFKDRGQKMDIIVYVSPGKERHQKLIHVLG